MEPMLNLSGEFETESPVEWIVQVPVESFIALEVHTSGQTYLHTIPVEIAVVVTVVLVIETGLEPQILA